MLPMAHDTTQDQDDRTQIDLDDDELVWTAAEIGKTIGRSARAVFYLHSIQAIPTKSVGGRLVARRSRLLAIAD
jgi:hypothetical protein